MAYLEDELNDLDRANNIINIAPLSYDIVSTLCGKFIAAGSYRSVFEYNLKEGYVIKIEPRNTNCNIIEHMIWDEVKGLKGDLEWVKNWFAPVEWISPNGRVMVMKKTKESHPKLKKPDKIPAFLWDVKWTNFGWIGKNYVCHDYGQFYNMISYSKKMKKINWETAGY